MKDADFNLLSALDVLLSTRSVAGASRRLGLSASAMSRTLTRLRTVTGDPLLVRAGREMVLTPYAEGLREKTRETVFAARQLLRPEVSEVNLSTLERTFTLRANDGFISTFGAMLITTVTARAPGIRLRFTPKADKNAQYLRDGLADIEIGVPGETAGPEIRLQALFRDRFVGVVSHRHPLAGVAQVSLQDYVRWQHIATSRQGKYHGPVDSALAEHGLQRNVVAVVPGFAAALAVARGSELIALVPASLMRKVPGAENSPDLESLKMFELPVVTATITISQMWHPRDEKDPAHRWLRQQLLAVCQQ